MNFKGKQLSLLSKLMAVFIVVACLLVEILSGRILPMNDVIKVALFTALVFSPVDISLWIETFFESFRNRPSIILPCNKNEDNAEESEPDPNIQEDYR